jgi:hypothetical protein
MKSCERWMTKRSQCTSSIKTDDSKNVHPKSDLPAAVYRSIYVHSLLISIYIRVYGPLSDLGRFFGFLILYIVGRTPWTGDQSVTRPLPIHRTTQTHNKCIVIHASSGIRIHDSRVRASEDSSCLRPCCHCDRLFTNMV